MDNELKEAIERHGLDARIVDRILELETKNLSLEANQREIVKSLEAILGGA